MRTNLIKYSIYLNIFLGILIYFIRGEYFFGDAISFSNYDTIFDVAKYIGNLRICSSKFISIINGVFISTIYDLKFSPIIINSLLIYIFYYFLKRNQIIDFCLNPKRNKKSQSKLLTFLISALILNPAFWFRFSEPSREYIIFSSLFITGIYFAKNKLNAKIFTLIIPILARPIWIPIYGIWIFTINFLFYIKRNNIIGYVLKLLLVCLLSFGSVYFYNQINLKGDFCKGINDNFIYFKEQYKPREIKIEDIPLINNLENSPSIEKKDLQIIEQIYSKTIYSKEIVLNNIFLESLLNIVGDINSFASKRYEIFYRFYYLFAYIFRFIIIYLAYRLFGWRSIFFVAASALSIAIFAAFPHARYLEPCMYLFIGYFSTKLVNNEKYKF